LGQKHLNEAEVSGKPDTYFGVEVFTEVPGVFDELTSCLTFLDDLGGQVCSTFGAASTSPTTAVATRQLLPVSATIRLTVCLWVNPWWELLN
jgi:hypothetical protein